MSSRLFSKLPRNIREKLEDTMQLVLTTYWSTTSANREEVCCPGATHVWSVNFIFHTLVFICSVFATATLQSNLTYWVLNKMSDIFQRTLSTHWGRVTHICVSDQTIISSDNGLSPGWNQAIIWTNAGILLIGLLGTNVSEILIQIQTFSFKKTDLKVSSAKWWPFCLSVLSWIYWIQNVCTLI